MNMLNQYRPGTTSVIAVFQTRIAEIATLRSKLNVYLMGLLDTCSGSFNLARSEILPRSLLIGRKSYEIFELL